MTDENDPPEELLRDYWELVRAWVRADRRRSGASPLDDSAIAGSVFEEALRIWRRTPPEERHTRETWAPWLRTIMKYKINEAVRENLKQDKAFRALAVNSIPQQNHVGDIADDVVSAKFLDSAFQCIERLPEPDRSILRLLWRGNSVDEAARKLGLNRPAVGMRVTRIKKYVLGDGGFARPSAALKDLRETFGRGQE